MYMLCVKVVECKVCKKAVQKDVLPPTPLDRVKERMLSESNAQNGPGQSSVATPGKATPAKSSSSSSLANTTTNIHASQSAGTSSSKIPSKIPSQQPQKFSFLSSVNSVARPSLLPSKPPAPLVSATERRQSAPGKLMSSNVQPSATLTAVLSGVKRPGEEAPAMPNLLELERMNKKKKKRLSEGGDS